MLSPSHISYVSKIWSHVCILKRDGFSGSLMPLGELCDSYASMGVKWPYLENRLMKLTPLPSEKLLRLSPSIHLMQIYKSNLPRFTMIRNFLTTMLLEELNSRPISTGWRLAIKPRRISFRLSKPIIPMLGLKRSNRE